MKIIIFGPQGSGKGTQAQKLTSLLHVPHITTGELFRNEIKNDTEIGKKVAEIIRRGILVDDALTLDILKKRLAEADCSNGFILDGYPRNLNQAKSLDEIASIDKALEIGIPDDEVVSRISNRRTCKNCGAVYNLITNPPVKPGICDKDQGELVAREDDAPEAIAKRLELYHQQTEPLKEYYAKQSQLITIDGRPAIEEVYKQVINKLGITNV